MGGGRPPPPLQSLICAPIVPHPATYADCKPDQSGVAWATACVRLVRDDGACLDGLEAGGGADPPSDNVTTFSIPHQSTVCLSYVSRRGLRNGAGGFREEDRACFDGSRAGRMAAALHRPFRASFAHHSSRTPPPTRIASPIKAVQLGRRRVFGWFAMMGRVWTASRLVGGPTHPPTTSLPSQSRTNPPFA